MPVIVGLHYLTAFVLELALLLGFGLFGFRLGQGGLFGAFFAVLLVGLTILIWARFAAPRSATRLPEMQLLVFKTAIFAAGALALWAAGWHEAAIAFGIVSVLDLGASAGLRRV